MRFGHGCGRGGVQWGVVVDVVVDEWCGGKRLQEECNALRVNERKKKSTT